MGRSRGVQDTVVAMANFGIATRSNPLALVGDKRIGSTMFRVGSSN